MKPTRALLIFAKAPKAGSVKTRLHSAVTPQLAAQNHAELFREIPWSTERVCELTMRLAKNAGLRVRRLRRDFDLDRPEDLRRAQKMLRKNPQRAPTLAKLLRALK